VIKRIAIDGRPCSAFAQGSTIVSRPESSGSVLVQQIEYRYRQNISRFYEVGCPDVWLIAGRSFGKSTLLQPTAPTAVAKSFYTSFNGAHSATGRVQCTTPLGPASNANIVLDRCVLATVEGTTIERGMISAASASLLFLGISRAARQPPPGQNAERVRSSASQLSSVEHHLATTSSRSVWAIDSTNREPLPSTRSIEVPIEYSRHDLIANRVCLALPRLLLPCLAKEFGSVVLDESRQELDLALSQVCDDLTLCIGFDRGLPIIYHLLRRQPLSGIPHAWKSLVPNWRLKLVEARCRRAFETAKGYAGWLVTNRWFIDEHDALVGRVAPNGPISTDLKEKLRAFCRRWRLSALVAPRLPVPLMAHNPAMVFHLAPLSMESSTTTFHLPDICPPPSRDELRNMLEECARGGDSPEHLAGWMQIVSSANSAKNQITRYARIFEVQHYCRILSERYPSALVRGQHKLERALAKFLHVSTATIRGDLQVIRRRLGEGWMRRGNDVTRSASSPRAAHR
jgi:hypothetical protein